MTIKRTIPGRTPSLSYVAGYHDGWLSHQPSYISVQDSEGCMFEFSAGSSGQQHGGLALSVDEIEGRIHSGL